VNRRNFLSTALGVPALAAMAGSLSTLLAACGDDEAATEPSYADGPNDVVLSIRYEGGFVPMGFAFVNTPTLLVSGDGRVFEPGMQTLEFPGPLLSPVMVRPISAAGIRKVIRLAGDAGLLAAPPDYSLPGGMMVADAPTTVVTITVGGQTYRHAAEALGLGIGDGTSTPARDNLAAFVEVMTDITAVAGTGEVGEPIPFDPDRYRLQAMEANPADWGEPAPTVVDWPAGTGVVLAEAATCATATAEGVGQVLTAADQLTFFREGDVVYQVFAAGMLPGDAEC